MYTVYLENSIFREIEVETYIIVDMFYTHYLYSFDAFLTPLNNQ